ncbi:MAG: helix-turn-helix domain-containing protein [Butyricicoccaceae bacterium]
MLDAVDQVRAPVWDELAEFTSVVHVRDGEQAYRLLKTQEFEIVLVDLHLPKIDGLELLRRIQRERLCPTVVLTSQFPSFHYAQQGILYGAFDYLLRPLERKAVLQLIERIQSQDSRVYDIVEQKGATVLDALGTARVSERFLALAEYLDQQHVDRVQVDVAIQRFYRTVIERTFVRFPWLSSFQNPKEYEKIDWLDEGERMIRDYGARRLNTLSQVIQTLYPETGDDKFGRILWYILEHIDENCLQKEIAAEHFLSSSTLSELFQRRLHCTYHSYIGRVKMLRAEYLLQHSELKIYEISTLLGYKDTNYFSRIFRKTHQMTLSEYRRQSNGDYQI